MISPRIAVIGATLVSVFVVIATGILSALLYWREIPTANRELAVAMIGGFGPLLGIVVKSWLDLLIHLYNAPTTVMSQQSGTQEVKTQ